MDVPNRADPEITPGTLVKLKSGGPRMTVISVYTAPPGMGGDPKSYTAATCQWFAHDVNLCGPASFPVAALRIVPEGEAA